MLNVLYRKSSRKLLNISNLIFSYVFKFSTLIFHLITPSLTLKLPKRGTQKLKGENLEVVWGQVFNFRIGCLVLVQLQGLHKHANI